MAQAISIDVEHGEFVAIIGASGSGKSTLMNILGLLERPSARRLMFEGRDCSRLSSEEVARVAEPSDRLRVPALPFASSPLGPAQRGASAGVCRRPAPERRRRAERALRPSGCRRRRATPGVPTPAASSSGSRCPGDRRGPALLLRTNRPARWTRPRADGAGSHGRHARRGRALVVVTHRPSDRRPGARIVRLQDGGIVADGRAKVFANAIEAARRKKTRDAA